jgi:hypothetical protein
MKLNGLSVQFCRPGHTAHSLGFLALQPGLISSRNRAYRSLSYLLVLFALVFMSAGVAKGDTVALGVLSYDVIIPGTVGSVGIDAFTLYNASGAFSLPPDLPVASDLTFLGATVTPEGLGASSYGDQGPGASQILFLDSNVFASAVFQATLNQTLFTLSDGTSFQADSNVLTATLLPSNGTALVAGVDSVLLTVSGTPVVTAVPEPSSLLILAGALPLLLMAKRMSLRVKDSRHL